MPDRPSSTELPPMPDLTGRTLGDFRLLRKIGQGGMGQVYLSHQLSLKREVALKILRKDLADTATARKRFQAEAEAVARISHPNITQVYAVGEQEGLRYMALEYVPGRNLRDYLERKGPPELPVALAIMKQVAAALQKASEVGLVHRDIKPENILLTRKVEVKVTDFGLSTYYAGDGKPLSLTQSGMTLGTPLYMSPEQVQGKPVDHRSDLYSFGVTCYHLLAGFPPFTGQTAFDVALQHVQQEADPLLLVRPDLPTELCALVARLMMKDPADRYQTAKEVGRDLSRIVKGSVSPPLATGTLPMPSSTLGPLSLRVSLSGSAVGGVAVGPAATNPLAPAPAPSNRWPWRVLALIGVVGLGLLGWFGYGWAHPVPVPPQPPVVVGLPEVRLPAPVVTPRERELRELAAVRPAGVPQARAALDLGIHLIAEHRLDEADAAFKELGEMKLKPAESPVSPQTQARFGHAVALALRDKPVESNAIFEEAIKELPRGDRRRDVDKFFFEHPTFAQMVSSAVARNADNLEALRQKPPPALEWLRSPGGVLNRPR